MKRGRPAKYGRKIKRAPDEALARCVANAAESMRRITLTLQQANAAGLSYGQFVAEERSKIMSDTPNVTPTADNTPTDTPTKRGIREPLPPEKVERVKEMLAEGAKIGDIIAETLVSRATIDRIKNGTYGVKQPTKPKPDKPAPALEPKPDILRQLISEVSLALADVSGACENDDKAIGRALGLLTAAEMMLGG